MPQRPKLKPGLLPGEILESSAVTPGLLPGEELVQQRRQPTGADTGRFSLGPGTSVKALTLWDEIRRGLLRGIPAAGALAGGIVGGTTGGVPGAIVGAGVGGGGGEALRQHIVRGLGYGGPETGAEAGTDISTQIALGAAGEAIPAALQPIAQRLKATAMRQMGSALKPTSLPEKGPTPAELRAERLAPELLERRISTRGLSERATGTVRTLGRQIGHLESEAAQTASQIGPIIKDLQTYRAGLGIKGTGVADPQVTRAAQSAVDDILADLASIQKGAGGKFQKVSRESLRNFRQKLDRAVAKTPTGHEVAPDIASRAEAQKEAADAIRRQLHKERPDIETIDAEFSFWKDVAATAKRVERKHKPPLISPPWLAAGAVASVGGVASGAPGLTGGGLAGAATFGVALPLARRVFGSPGWKSVSAIKKAQLADLLAASRTRDVARIMTGMLQIQQTPKE